jgi:hypothetical protein
MKVYRSKRTHQRKGSMRDIRAQKARGLLGEPWVSHDFWRRLQGKGVFLENMICAPWRWPWEKTQVACAITTV